MAEKPRGQPARKSSPWRVARIYTRSKNDKKRPRLLKLRPGSRSILNTKKANLRTAEIEQANSIDSPLLRLPAEIRNRIYEFVFNIGILHLGTELHDFKRTLPKTICCVKDHEYDVVQAIRNSNTYDGAKCFSHRHYMCEPAASDKEYSEFWQILDILRVSRQIHREAALLPYQLNTFYFAHPEYFPHFRNALSLDQRKAVRSVGFFLRDHLLLHEAGPRLDDMRGIEEIFIFLQLQDSMDYIHGSWHFFQEDSEYNDFGSTTFRDLKKADLDLRYASFVIYPVVYPHSPEADMAFAILNNWNARVEQKLLEVDEEKDERTKKRTRSGKGYAARGTKTQKLD